jgi:hypothetical protein
MFGATSMFNFFLEITATCVWCHLNVKTFLCNNEQLHVSIHKEAEILIHIPFFKKENTSISLADEVWSLDVGAVHAP